MRNRLSNLNQIFVVIVLKLSALFVGFDQTAKMSTMDNYIQSIPTKLRALEDPSTKVKFVMGNEACDLDSAVSSLVYAHFLSSSSPGELVLPVLNILREDLELKSEVVYCIQEKLGLFLPNIPCRDDLDFDTMSDLSFVLVDFNTFSGPDEKFNEKVVEIIDHHKVSRPLNNATIEMVGSCTTLVMRKIWETSPDFNDPSALQLTRWTILIDTNNLSKETKKATPVDVDILEKVEAKLSSDNSSRSSLYEEILRAKKDVSALSISQMLRKDLKSILEEDNPQGNIAMSSITILASEMAKKKEFLVEADRFLKNYNYGLLVILGSNVSPESGQFERDILVYPVAEGTYGEVLANTMAEEENYELQIIETDVSDYILLKQKNVSFGRKVWLPVVSDLVKNNTKT